MKKLIFALSLLLAATAALAQDFAATINQDWPKYASDTSLTYTHPSAMSLSPFREDSSPSRFRS